MKKIFFGLFLIGSLFSFSQTDGITSNYVNHYNNVIPETPQASGFRTYGNTPVDYSTGIPQINIPIYTIKEDGVEIPISISYHASGVKVDELASAVGLKWTLNTGGGISRNINDEPDEHGWINPGFGPLDYSWYENKVLSERNTQTDIKNMYKTRDNAPDDFYFSFLGNSGSFIFDTDGAIIKDKNDNLKIDFGFSYNTISDIHGNRFLFSETEHNDNIIVNKRDYMGLPTSTYGENTEPTGWMLSNVTTRNHKSISFSYEPYSLEYTILGVAQNITEALDGTSDPADAFWYGCNYGCGAVYDPGYLNGKAYFENTSIIYKPTSLLTSEINTTSTKVKFYYSEDESLSTWKKQLDSIEVIDKVRGVQKKFHFAYDKFGGDPRLMLKEVYEVAQDGTKKPSHKFEYHNPYLPQKGSYSKDTWGYNNGAANSSIIPFTLSAYGALQQHYKTRLADRKYSENYLKAGTLKSITYPTGGKTEFDYEPNVEEVTSGEGKIFTGESLLSTHIQTPEHINNEYVFSTTFEIQDIAQISNALQILSSSEVCDYLDENGPNIDCSKYWIYDAIFVDDGSPKGTYVKGNLVLGPRVVGAETNLSLPKGKYIIEMKVDEDILQNLPLANWPEIKVELRWYEFRKDVNGITIFEPHYTGGLRVKEIRDIDVDMQSYNYKQFSYSGINGKRWQRSFNYRKYTQSMNTHSSDIIDMMDVKSGLYYDKVTIRTSQQFPESYNAPEFPTLNSYKEVYEYEDASSTKTFMSKLKKASSFNTSDTLIKSTEYNYDYSNQHLLWYALSDLTFCYDDGIAVCIARDPETGQSFAPVYAQLYGLGYDYPYPVNYKNKISSLNHTISKDYIDNEVVESKTYYTYNDDLLVTNQVTTTSQFSDAGQLEQRMSTTTTYPGDYPNEVTLQDLVDDNILSLPISKETYNKNEQVYGQFNSYDTEGNIVEVFTHNKGKGSNTSTLNYIPSDYESVSTFTHNAGKPTQIVKNTGETVSYIWDKSNTYVLAKVINATLGQANAQLTQELDLAILTDSQLRDELDKIRQGLPNAQITTYTYEPLVGVTSVTDARGYTSTYHYDEFSRLQYVKDAEGNILSENQYNYRPQN